MVDVRIKKEIYCIQFYDQKFGISHVVEDLDFGTIPDEIFHNWDEFFVDV